MPIDLKDIPYPDDVELDINPVGEPSGNIPVDQIPFPDDVDFSQMQPTGDEDANEDDDVKQIGDSIHGSVAGAAQGAKGILDFFIDAARSVTDGVAHQDPEEIAKQEKWDRIRQSQTGVHGDRARNGIRQQADDVIDSAVGDIVPAAMDTAEDLSGGLELIASRHRDLRSVAYKKEDARLYDAMMAAEEGMPRFWEGVKGISTSPSMWAPKLAEVAGGLAVQAGVGVFAKTPGALLAGAMGESGSAADETFAELMEMDIAFFKASERYLQLGERGMTEDEAKVQLSHELSAEARWKVTTVALFISALPVFNRLDKILGGQADTAAKTVAQKTTAVVKTAGAEAIEEGVIDEYSGVASNQAVQEVDPSRRTFEGLGRSGQAVVLGAKAGGLTQAAAELSSPTKRAADTVDPTDTTQPTDTVDPTDTTQPTDTVDPTDAAQPTDTVDPTDAAQPTDTVESDNSFDPTTTAELDALAQSDVDTDTDTDTDTDADTGPTVNVIPDEITPTDTTGDTDADGDVDTQLNLDLDDASTDALQQLEMDFDSDFTPVTDEQKAQAKDRTKQLELDLAPEPAPVATDEGVNASAQTVDTDAVAEEQSYDDPQADSKIDFDGSDTPDSTMDFDGLRADENYAFDDDAESSSFIDDMQVLAAPDSNSTIDAAIAETDAAIERTIDRALAETDNNDARRNAINALDAARKAESEQEQNNIPTLTNRVAPNPTQVGSQANPSESLAGDQSNGNIQSGNPRAVRQGQDANVRQSQDSTPTAGVGKTNRSQRDQGRSIPESNNEVQSRVDTEAEANTRPQSTNPVRRPPSRQRKKVRAYIDKIASDTNGRVVVHDNVESSDLDADLKAHMLEHMQAGTQFPGLYDPDSDRIYVFADLINTQKEARALIAHETVHAALMDYFGSEQDIEAGLAALFDVHTDMKGVLDRLAHESGFDQSLYTQVYGNGTRSPLKLTVFMEEVLAHKRESDAATPAIDKLLKSIRAMLKKMGIALKPRGDETGEQALMRLLRDAEQAFDKANARKTSAREAKYGVPKAKWMRTRYSAKPIDEQAEWYSKLHEVAINLKQKKGSPDQMMAMLKKSPGVKQEEIVWTGLDNFMQLQGKSVTSDAIADYLYNNGVNIETLVRGDTIEEINGANRNQGDLRWNEGVVDEDSSHWEYRVDDLMSEFNDGNPESHIMDTDEAINKHLLENMDELMQLVEEHIGDTPEAKAAFDYAMKSTTDTGVKILNAQMDLLGEQSVFDAIDEATGHAFSGEDMFRLARAVNTKQLDVAFDLIELDAFDTFKDKIEDEYREAAEKIAEAEYRDNPYVRFEALEHDYSIFGNDDVGYTISLDGDVIDSEVYDIDEAKGAANHDRDERGHFDSDYYSGETETKFAEYLDEGDYNWYDEVLITLPDVEGEFVQSAHFDEPNVVAFVRSTDRRVRVGEHTARPYFIEEIQSDWHSQGNKEGYADTDFKKRQARLSRLSMSLRHRKERLATAYIAMLDDPKLVDANEINQIGDMDDESMKQVLTDGINEYFGVDSVVLFADTYDVIVKYLEDVEIEEGVLSGRFKRSAERVRAYANKIKEEKYAGYGRVPDAPYKDMAWLELAAKESIKQAIDRGHEHVAWHPAQKAVERWGNNEKLRPKFDMIYETKLPSIMKKLTGSKARKTDDGSYVVTLDQDKLDTIKAKVRAKFSAQRSSTGSQTPTQISQQLFDRTGKGFMGYKGHWDNFMRTLVDHTETGLRAQQYVQENGGRVDKDTKFSEAFKRVPGRVMPRLDDIETKYVRPLSNFLKNNELVLSELSMFAYARHAPKRNADMRKRLNLPDTESPSGMSDAEAGQWMDHFKSEGKIAALIRASDTYLETMRKDMVDLAVEAGLIHEAEAMEYDSRKNHYVPLKGFAVTFDKNGDPIQPAKGRSNVFQNGLNVSGRDIRAALGRDSKAFDPVATLIADFGQMTIRAEQNVAGNHLLHFAWANQKLDMFEIYTDARPKKTKALVKSKDPVTGLPTYKTVYQAMSPMQMSQNFFTTKFNGNQFYIKIQDQRLKDMVMNGRPDEVKGILHGMRSVNRFLSYIYTSLSLPFAVGNFLRDVPTAYVKVLAEQSLDDGQVKDQSIANKMVSTVPQAFRSAHRLFLKKPPREGNEMDMSAYLMQKEGGFVGYYQTKSPEQTQQDLAKILREGEGVGPGRFKSKALGAMWESAGAIKDAIDHANRVIENSIRLSAFHQARMTGRIPDKLNADFARELTVDFNAHGTHTNHMGAFFLFFNPAVQGTRNFMRVMNNFKGDGSKNWRNMNDGQKAILIMAAGLVAYSHLMRRMMGEDDDGEDRWDKRADHIKERSIALPNFATDNPDDMFTIPVPYGYNAVFAMSQGIEQILAKGSEGIKPAMELMIRSTVNAFSPVGVERAADSFAGTVAKTTSPEYLKPFVELYANENYFGGQIYNEQRGYGLDYADSYDSRLSTPQLYKDIATGLNAATGGTQRIAGMIDMHPETLQYWTKFLTGGAGTVLIDQGLLNTTDALNGKPYNWERLPVLGSFYTSTKHYQDIDAFYTRSNDLGVALEDWRDARVNADQNKMEKIERKYGNFQRLVPLANSTRERMSALRKRRNNVLQSETIGNTEAHKIAKGLEDEIGLLADIFNREYNTTMRAK